MLDIGKNLKLPVEAATETFALIGRRGSGKTNAACVLVEEMLKKKVQVVIMDPVGVWWGLKSDCDGRGAGFPITVLGGEHADLPLNESSGAVVADFLVEHQISCVLDTSLFSKSAQRRFVADLLERIYRRKGEDKHKTPLHLVIEEADCFAPQRLFAGDERMFGAVDTLVRRGRSRGVGVTLISQRPQVINKDVLSQVEVLACLQINSPQDRKAVEAWVEAHDIKGVGKEFMDSLAGLERGEAWFWSPGLLDCFKRVHVRARSTFDSSATPKVGEKRVEPKHLAKVDIEKLREALGATIKAAEDDDPRKLRTKIAELEKSLRYKVEHAQAEKIRFMSGGIEKSLVLCQDLKKKVIAEIDRILLILEGKPRGIGFSDDYPAKPSNPGEILRPLGQPLYVVEKQASSPTSGLRRILIALAQHNQGCTRAQLAIFAGLSPNSGSFSTYLSRARSARWIENGLKTNGYFILTPEGQKEVGDYDPLPMGDNLFGYWLNEVGENNGEGRILKTLLQHHSGLSRDHLAEASNLAASSGSFSTYLSRLRTRGLITTGNPIKLSEELRD